MGTNARNTVGLKLIQLASDTYVIQHQCVLSEMKTLRIGERICVIYSNNSDPFVFPARVLELWQEGDVLFLKLWNYRKDKWEIYTQDLSIEDCLFQFVSIPFITMLSEVMVDKSVLESRVLNNQNQNRQGQSFISNESLKSKPDLPQSFFNSSGKMVMKYISESVIELNLPFILTKDKRLKLNMPYLKTENCLSGNKISAIRLLNFDTYDTIIVLYVQDMQSKKTFSLEYNMDSTSGYWIWSLSDFENAILNEKHTSSK
jgi:hypothetical protein